MTHCIVLCKAIQGYVVFPKDRTQWENRALRSQSNATFKSKTIKRAQSSVVN